jgi:hypothetical protein
MNIGPIHAQSDDQSLAPGFSASDVSVDGSTESLSISVVVPALNEAENLVCDNSVQSFRAYEAFDCVAMPAKRPPCRSDSTLQRMTSL